MSECWECEIIVPGVTLSPLVRDTMSATYSVSLCSSFLGSTLGTSVMSHIAGLNEETLHTHTLRMRPGKKKRERAREIYRNSFVWLIQKILEKI